MDQPIRLLHLSDIHFRTGTSWDSDPVLRALARFIGEEVRRGLQPDLVAITGDLAFSGKAEEYALALDWLEHQLWPAFSPVLSRDRLLLVPGNHDADRGRVGKGARHIQDGQLAERSQDAIAELLKDDDERDLVLKRHAAYLDFCKDWFGAAQPLPWWQRCIELDGQRLHIAGLDSAWMACGDTDRGRLLLGRYQVHQTVLHPDGEGADWRLALLHHPWDYLAEFDARTTKEALHLNRDLLLRGHLHAGEAFHVISPDPDRTCLELAAGCVYDGSDYPNAFQWIELYPAPRRVRVHFRLWVKGKWQRDRNQPGGDDQGVVEFRLPPRADPAACQAEPAAPAIPAGYLAWLRRTYGGVDLLGQDAQQGQSVTLSQVYCPAVTVPATPPAPAARPADAEQPPPTLLLQRLDASSLYCPAPPGAGKSTFCRWAVLQGRSGTPAAHPVPAPDGFQEPTPTHLRARLPLLVPLREFWEAMDCGHGRRTWCRDELTRTLAAWVDGRLRPDGLAGDLELERLLRRFAQLNPAYEQGRVEPAVQREELLTHSGLLLPRPNGRAAFYHLSFQEFLAAERISRTSAARRPGIGLPRPLDRPGVAPDAPVSVRRAGLRLAQRPVGPGPVDPARRRARSGPNQGQPGPGRLRGRGPGSVPGQGVRDPPGFGRRVPPDLSGCHRRRGRGQGAPDPGALPGPARRSAHPKPARPRGLCRSRGWYLCLRREERDAPDRGPLPARALPGDQQPVPRLHRRRRLYQPGLVVRRGLGLAATDGRHRAVCLAGTALERPQSASDRRLLLGGSSLLPLGRGAPAERARMGGRRPRPAGVRVPLGRHVGGRDLQQP